MHKSYVWLLLLFSLAANCCDHREAVNKYYQASGDARLDGSHALSTEYQRIRIRIGPMPSSFTDSWSLSYDHLFSGYDHDDVDTNGMTLRQECETFVRRDGALDYLFEKVIDSSTQDDEIFTIAEILTFWIGQDQPKDSLIKPLHTDDFLHALDGGRVDHLEETHPNLWLKGRLYASAKKAKNGVRG